MHHFATPTVCAVLSLTLNTLAADDLVAVWHFDELRGSRVLDATSNGLDGKLCGATRVDGRFGKAIECDGVDDYVRLPGVGRLEEGTVEAWVKLLKPTSGQTGFVTFGMGYGKKHDLAVLGSSPKMPKFTTTPASFGICTNAWVTAQDSTGLDFGEWHHVAGTWGPGGIKFYRNGELTAQADDYTGAMPEHRSVLIGASAWNSHTACVVDEVRIYRAALPATALVEHCQNRSYVATPPQPDRRSRALNTAAIANVGDFYNGDDPTCGIQAAIDSLPPPGGIVTIPPGTYLLKRAICLRSNVTLQGAGPSTILTRAEQARAKPTKTAQKGERAVSVESTDGFEVGIEVGVKSRKMGGWYVTHAFITAIEGNVIELDRPLTKTYEVSDNAVVINYFPAINVTAKSNVVIQDLCIDGNIEENPGPETDFTFEAIHFWRATGSVIQRCVVRGWPSDGIGVQGGSNVKVLNCTASGCRGHGYHPGTSLRHAVWDGNLGHHNAADGLYFCANVQFIVVSNSVFHHNGGDGIGGLGGGGDRYNVVSSNVCEANRQHGIEAVGGTENTIADNICINNSQMKAGAFAGIAIHDTTHTTVTGNRCLDNQKKPAQLVGIRESGKSDHNLFVGNHLLGCAETGLAMSGDHSKQHGNMVAEPLAP